ncbi:cobalt ABC transporter permease [Aestuariispira insulae]|uniref:Nickel transport protein n=1 Tax=Aestuariispira insulae TaxID=1461337 RepID=A0A3D9HW95_9PROT|nr:cobalt ABC transporter permease [Aestuariispira insulae]RED53685.1 nickel transport protein [Aestuariispira insulae]
MTLFKSLALPTLFAVALFSATPASAHKVIASAFAEGDLIEGEIGFSNGEMATNQAVEVFAEDGRKLGDTHTDEEGFFTFQPTEQIVHIFRANLGAGHVAEYRMEIDELPDGLAGGQAPASTGAKTVSAPATAVISGSVAPDALKELVAEAVRREVKPLRREIAAYKEKNNLQSILGGIGYIIGIFGLAAYLAARRRQKQSGIAGQAAE